MTTIEHDAGASRFIIHSEGEAAGYAAYRREGTVWTFYDTSVEPRFEGRGLAGELVGHALDVAIADGGTIVPQCSYVAAYVRQHPHYREYLAPGVQLDGA